MQRLDDNRDDGDHSDTDQPTEATATSPAGGGFPGSSLEAATIATTTMTTTNPLHPPLTTTTEDKVIVPPLNFAIVAPGVYRSGHPNRKNHPFLRRLRLRSLLYLGDDHLTADNERFLRGSSSGGAGSSAGSGAGDATTTHEVQIFCLPLDGNKEPFREMDRAMVCYALLVSSCLVLTYRSLA